MIESDADLVFDTITCFFDEGDGQIYETLSRLKGVSLAS